MNSNLPIATDTHSEEREHPLIRAAYAIGVGLVLLGSVMPHGERWTTGGIALMAAAFFF